MSDDDDNPVLRMESGRNFVKKEKAARKVIRALAEKYPSKKELFDNIAKEEAKTKLGTLQSILARMKRAIPPQSN